MSPFRSTCLPNHSQGSWRNWTRQLSNLSAMREDSRWRLNIPPPPNTTHSFLLFGLQTWICSPALAPLRRFCDVILSKQREGEERASCPLQPIGEQLAHVITKEQEEHEGAADPYCASNGIYIPCLCVITFHTLHPLSLLTYADPIFKVRAYTKAQKRFFFCLFLFVLTAKCLFIFIYLTCQKLKRRLDRVSQRQRGKRAEGSIKINNVLAHSFSDK